MSRDGSAAVTSGRNEPSPRRRRLARLKLVVALGLLAWVGSSLPWRDVLAYTDPATSFEASYSGEIVGDWRAETIRFRLAPAVQEPAPPGAAGDAFRAAAAADEPLLFVERSAPPADGTPSAGWEWRPSFTRVFREMDPRGLLAAFALLVLGSCFGITRWWRLLNLASCPTSYYDAFRLSYLGLFFNLVLPGLTGGDVVKAVLVVREHPERRADAFVTVVLDRLIGLWSLIGLACGVIWVVGDELLVLRWPVTLTFLAATVGVGLILVPGPRRALGVDRLLARLPQGERLLKLDRAADVLHGKPLEMLLALVLSLGNHLCVAFAVFAVGRAFGDTLSPATYTAVVSVANTLSAIPITPGGWGWGEQVFGVLFSRLGSEFALGVAISVTYRLCTLALGLCGGLFLLAPGAERVRAEALEAGEALGD